MNGIRPDEVEVVCQGGPGAGTRVSVGVGRHVVGRARTAAVTVADDAVELHHLLLEVASGQTVRLVQLTGRVPCRVDGSPVGGGGVVITRGATLSVGASRLRVGDPPAPGPAPVPVPAPTLPLPVTGPVVLPRPVSRSVRGPVLATVTAVVLVVAARGPSAGPAFVAAAVLAAVTAITVRRERVGRRAAAEALATSLDGLGRELETRRRAWIGERGAGALDLAAAVAMAQGASGTCWTRDDEGGGQYLVAIGLGPDRWRADVVAGGPVAPAALDLVRAAEQPLDVPVTADLGPGRVLTLSGPGAAGIARALVVQLATAVGPDQLRIGFRDVAGDRPPVWAERLPHVAPVPAGDGHHEIVVVQRPDVVERPPDAIRTRLLVPPSAALVLVDEPARTTVSPVGGRLDLGLVGRSRWRRAPDEVAARDVHPAGLDERSAADVAQALAARVVVGGPPAAVTLAELLAARGGPRPDDTIGVAAAWLTDPVTPDALVGMAGDGVVAIPLGAGAGPVVVIGDDTAAVDRAVTTIVTTWAATVAPHRRAVIRIDMTAATAPWHDLPHVTQARAAAPSSSLVVTDDRDGPETTHPGRREDLLVVAGPDPSPTARAVMSHPGVTTIALRLGDEALARRAVGDGRPCRIGVDTAVVRAPGRAARLVRLPGPPDPGLAELAGAVRHAAALSAGVGVSPTGA